MPYRILVVDDEMIVRHTLEAQLGYLGHHVKTTEDGMTGIRALENGNYDAAIVDIKMPGLDGVGFLRRAKEMRPGMPVIMITGHGSDETRDQVMALGAFAFLKKPFQLSELSALLDDIETAKAEGL